MLESGQRRKSAAITISSDVRFFIEVRKMNYVDILFKELNKALKQDEVPVSALIVKDNKIIAKAFNSRENNFNTLDHAEIKCILLANKRLRNKNLSDCVMYVTLEPCEMCKIIIKEARIKEVFYLIERSKEKKQYFKTNFQNWDINEEKKNEYQEILENFFKKRR